MRWSSFAQAYKQGDNLITWLLKSRSKGRRDGFVFENFIFNILLEKTFYTSERIHFWRTKDGAEVDFILDDGNELTPYEVKYKDMRTPEITRGLKSFIAKYKPARAFVVHLGEHYETRVGETSVSHIPFYKLLKA